jgi:hypothetical protein
VPPVVDHRSVGGRIEYTRRIKTCAVLGCMAALAVPFSSHILTESMPVAMVKKFPHCESTLVLLCLLPAVSTCAPDASPARPHVPPIHPSVPCIPHRPLQPQKKEIEKKIVRRTARIRRSEVLSSLFCIHIPIHDLCEYQKPDDESGSIDGKYAHARALYGWVLRTWDCVAIVCGVCARRFVATMAAQWIQCVLPCVCMPPRHICASGNHYLVVLELYRFIKVRLGMLCFFDT